MRALSAALVVFLAGCTVFQDNGTHLAYAIEDGAKELLASRDSERVVRYAPLGGPDQPYDITITASRHRVRVDNFGNIDKPGGSYLVVTGQRRGGTGYHERFVFIPQPLRI